MKIKRISAYAEIVSSVAIVVTLVYLTIETRQNTEALMANSRQAALNGDLVILSNAMVNPEVGATLFGGQPGQPDQSAEDIRRRALVIAFLRVREFVWFQYQTGQMDEETWGSYMRPALAVLGTPEAMDVFNSYNGNPEFIAYVEDFLRKAATAP